MESHFQKQRSVIDVSLHELVVGDRAPAVDRVDGLRQLSSVLFVQSSVRQA